MATLGEDQRMSAKKKPEIYDERQLDIFNLIKPPRVPAHPELPDCTCVKLPSGDVLYGRCPIHRA